MRYLVLAVLLSSCAHRKIVFLDSTEQAIDSAHVCLVKSESLECITLEAFVRLMKQRARQHEAENTSEL